MAINSHRVAILIVDWNLKLTIKIVMIVRERIDQEREQKRAGEWVHRRESRREQDIAGDRAWERARESRRESRREQEREHEKTGDRAEERTGERSGEWVHTVKKTDAYSENKQYYFDICVYST